MTHASAKLASTKTVHLHQASCGANPVQLDLFQTLISQNYSNSVELYQSLPDTYVGKQEKLRRADGSLPMLSRQGMYNGIAYTLDIAPAYVSIIDANTRKKTKRAFYKTVVAEFIEHALHKLSVTDGFFKSQDGSNAQDNFALVTTFYKLREELKRMGKTYSYEQLREGVSTLAGLRYELSGEVKKEYDIDSYFSPIDLTIKNNRANPSHSELYITFNNLISKKILAMDWRSFNYEEFMKLSTSFGRTLFMRLCHRFPQANPKTGYHFKLSTLIKEGALQNDLITTNIKKINQGLKDCSYIIDHYEIQEQHQINPSSKRQCLNDVKIIVYPTTAFQNEQFRVNTHHKALDEHRIDSNGQILTKPLRDQYAGDYPAFIEAQKAYDNALAAEPIK